MNHEIKVTGGFVVVCFWGARDALVARVVAHLSASAIDDVEIATFREGFPRGAAGAVLDSLEMTGEPLARLIADAIETHAAVHCGPPTLDELWRAARARGIAGVRVTTERTCEINGWSDVEGAVGFAIEKACGLFSMKRKLALALLIAARIMRA